MHVTEAVENYLEAILLLREQQGDVRAADICAYMGYSRPTVSIAVKGMRQSAFIEVDEHNLISLTEEGEAIAKGVYDRHKTISSLLEHLGVDKDTAAQDACKMEHDISDATFRAMQKFLRECSPEKIEE